MSQNVGTGYVPIRPDAEGFGAELEKSIEREGKPAASRASEKLRRTMAGVFAGGAALIGKSAWDFAGFEKGMNEVFTLLPGISGAAMGQMEEQVKGFATEFRVLPTEVIPALYQSLSAGVPKDNVFAFLGTAEKLARGGVTDLETAVDGLSSVVNAYGADVLSAGQASDLMFTTVKLGKTTISELSSALFQVTPTAAGLGVTFQDVSAAMAALTLQGIPTSVAATDLRQVLVELGKDGTKVSDIFREKTGKSFRQFTEEGGNLQQALAIVGTAAQESGLSISDLFGSVEAGSAALALTGPGAEAFSADLAAMQQSAGATDAAFATMNKGLAATWDGLRAKFAVTLLNIGEAIAPTLGKVGDVLAKLLSLFSKLPGPMQAVAVLAGTIGAGLFAFARPIREGIALFKQLGGVFSTLAANPWVLVLAGLVLAAVLIVKNWDKVKSALGAVWNWLRSAGSAVAGFFSGLWTTVSGAVVTAWDTITGAITSAIDWIGGLFSGLWNTVTGVFSGIVSTITGAWNTFTSITSTAWNTVKGIVSSIGGAVVGFITGIPSRIGSAFGTLAEVISAPFRAAFNAVKSLWNSTVGGFGFDIPSWVPFVGGKKFRIPEMADGGVVTAPTLALVGEYAGARQNPEIVAPQKIIRQTVLDAVRETAAAGGGAAGAQTIYQVTGPLIGSATIRSDQDVVDLSRNLARELTREKRAAGVRGGKAA